MDDVNISLVNVCVTSLAALENFKIIVVRNFCESNFAVMHLRVTKIYEGLEKAFP